MKEFPVSENDWSSSLRDSTTIASKRAGPPIGRFPFNTQNHTQQFPLHMRMNQRKADRLPLSNPPLVFFVTPKVDSLCDVQLRGKTALDVACSIIFGSNKKNFEKNRSL